MSVYRRIYAPYSAELTPERFRWLVVTRYALVEILASRALLAYLCVSVVPILASAGMVYLSHNPAARALIGLVKLESFFRVDAEFFRQYLSTQCFFGLILAAWVGPGLIASDLANGALPLYLSRPMSRVEYVLGKALVLLALLSSITWVPGLVIYLLNSIIASDGWGISHLRLSGALVAAGFSWMMTITLMVLALSAWIRWHLLASVSLFGIYFISAGLGEAVKLTLRLDWGRVLSLGYMFDILGAYLFGTPSRDRGVPPWLCAIAICLLCGFSLVVIHLRLRAREVVR